MSHDRGPRSREQIGVWLGESDVRRTSRRAAVVVNVAAYWWFGPVLAIIVISAGWKKLARFGAYVARAFAHSQGGS